jgi:hypothetical protein
MCEYLEVCGQLLWGVGHMHHTAVTEVDGGLHLVVLFRLGEECVGVLRRGWRLCTHEGRRGKVTKIPKVAKRLWQ